MRVVVYDSENVKKMSYLCAIKRIKPDDTTFFDSLISFKKNLIVFRVGLLI